MEEERLFRFNGIDVWTRKRSEFSLVIAAEDDKHIILFKPFCKASGLPNRLKETQQRANRKWSKANEEGLIYTCKCKVNVLSQKPATNELLIQSYLLYRAIGSDPWFLVKKDTLMDRGYHVLSWFFKALGSIGHFIINFTTNHRVEDDIFIGMFVKLESLKREKNIPIRL